MWLSDSPELNGNYSGFSERKIRFIKEILCILQYFIPGDMSNIDKKSAKQYCGEIDGLVFNKPGYIFHLNIYKMENIKGMDVQIVKKDDGSGAFFPEGGKPLFGVIIERENITNKILTHCTYHMGGPGQSLGNDLDDYI